MTTTDPWADTRRRLGANDDMRATDAYKVGAATSSVQWVLGLLTTRQPDEIAGELRRLLDVLTYGDDQTPSATDSPAQPTPGAEVEDPDGVRVSTHAPAPRPVTPHPCEALTPDTPGPCSCTLPYDHTGRHACGHGNHTWSAA